jgi:hypothetical protein
MNLEFNGGRSLDASVIDVSQGPQKIKNEALKFFNSSDSHTGIYYAMFVYYVTIFSTISTSSQLTLTASVQFGHLPLTCTI